MLNCVHKGPRDTQFMLLPRLPMLVRVRRDPDSDHELSEPRRQTPENKEIENR